MNWEFFPKITEEFQKRFPEINQTILQILANRGLLEKSEIDYFLNPENYPSRLADPFLLPDINQAVNRILQAVFERERVLVYGDYDADGITATVIVFETLKSLGVEVDSYIPFRDTEGYGLNSKAVERIAGQKFDLVITVDCGISNVEEIAALKEWGIETIVTDHHQPPAELPPALAIIDPWLESSRYPFKNLSGAGVAFKLVQAIIARQEEENLPLKLPAGFEKWFLDLTAIATVGDIVPLLGENRVLVKYGLEALKNTERPGLRKMIETINNFSDEFDSEYLGWRLVPRLNAAGRINDASLAFNLLTAAGPGEAEVLLAVLEDNNTRRQRLTDRILKEAEAKVGRPDEKKVIWAVGRDWPVGLLGLVAGRLKDKYYRPVLAVAEEQTDSEKYLGSGRSIPEFDITAALRELKPFLEKFGGHRQACGFTVFGRDNFLKFREHFDQLAAKTLQGINLTPTLKIEAELKLGDISLELFEELERLKPFGEANPKPIFAVRGVVVKNFRAVGKTAGHLQLTVAPPEDGPLWKAIGFNFSSWCQKLKINDTIDLVFEIIVNTWNGSRQLQLKLKDLKKSRTSAD